MPEPPSTFRDFGIIPDDLPPPPETIRGYFSGVRIFGQYLATLLVGGLGLALALLFAFKMSPSISLLACPATLVAFGLFVYLVTRNDYGWIELQGNVLCAKHLYTGRVIERSIGDIESLTTIVNVHRSLETVIQEKLLGRVKGIDIRFRGQPAPLRVMRSDPAMTNAKELIEAIVCRMRQIGEIDYEVVDFAGKPLLRKIYWKGQQQSARPRSSPNLVPGCLMFLALMFGVILAFSWQQEQEVCALASVPPREIALSALVQNGSGDNRHVTVTNFRPGGYAWQGRNGEWTEMSIALFPVGPGFAADNQIAAVLHSSAIRDEVALGRALQGGRVTGICSATRVSYWGAVAPNLLRANPGKQLASAWSNDELREPPDEWHLKQTFAGAAACLGAALALAVFIFWRNARIRPETLRPTG